MQELFERLSGSWDVAAIVAGILSFVWSFSWAVVYVLPMVFRKTPLSKECMTLLGQLDSFVWGCFQSGIFHLEAADLKINLHTGEILVNGKDVSGIFPRREKRKILQKAMELHTWLDARDKEEAKQKCARDLLAAFDSPVEGKPKSGPCVKGRTV